MKKRLPPLNWIRAFEASARHLSFTHAANELNLTQAAVSQQVKGLESQLGCLLFRRLPRGLELTDAGAAYLPAVHDSVERLTVATEEIFGHGRTNLLTIKVNMVFFIKWLAPRLKNFRKQHPGTNLRLTSNIWVNEVERENSLDSDLEIRYGKGHWQGMTSDRLTWDELFPVCSPDYLAKYPIDEDTFDLSEHMLLHVMGYEEGWGHWLSQANYKDIKTSQGFYMDTLVSALELAVLGEGIALGRTSLVRDLIDSGKLVTPFKTKIPTDEAFYLVYPNSHVKHQDVEAFRTWLLSEVQPAREADRE
ncbi:transcriptional regulator GcvA [Thalassotalea sp. G20_0]|uniref:transcriptional regulator GcvA n=1 Tax=Thalassotalea sp. G20_0 TaxID=2821093 RepID=UPI001ADB012D|nr:transcriptional regulator GcvA [Thalassotalea sp. G20_0]MBO9493069.1 transcriptional regulator GcvA [Thalassotalea sp. G20_0]